MQKLISVATGVSIGIFLGIVLFQMELNMDKERKKRTNGAGKFKKSGGKIYETSASQPTQTKTGKESLTDEGATGNTD